MISAMDRLQRVQEKIAEAAVRSGRNPKAVTLLAVTKTVPLERILPFVEAGVQHVGENRVQDALAKFENERGRLKTKFHLIGPLQSNKAKKATEFFDVIQTLDRFDLAKDLEQHAALSGKTLECLVQIKISEETTKSGLDPAALPELLGELKSFSHLRVSGLMGIPPLSAVGEKSRPYFARLRRLFEDAKSPPMTVLSMGMSSDFEAAIAEGATLVRIGSALFGSRPAQ